MSDRDYWSPTEKWLTIADALDLIVQRRQVGPDAARTILTDACASGKVLSRYIAAHAHQGKITIGQITPDTWRGGAGVNLNTGKFYSLDLGNIGPVRINDRDLRHLIERPRRGPKTGTLARYRTSDKALFPVMKRIMRTKKVSATEAATQLAEAGRVAGYGSPSSRAKRLVKLFNSTETH
jgi:hypothetical protein